MKAEIIDCWDAVMQNEKNPLRHLDLASQHYFMQVLGWMWSMVFSLSFLSIYHFGITWMLHIIVFGGIAFTVATFREAENLSPLMQESQVDRTLSHGSTCVWSLEEEA